MGIGGISIWQLLIILVIVMMIFGTKKLKSIGSDLGGAIKGFKNSMADDNAKDGTSASSAEPMADANTDALAEKADSDSK